MKTLVTLFALVTLAAAPLSAQGVAGKWHAEFDTQVGAQKYLFTLTQTGTTFTGTANAELGGQKRDVVLHDVKLKGDTLTFTETLDFQGNAVPITYTGLVAGEEINFTRQVGDFATEKFVAKREK
jgi:hypothetical protein